MGTERSRSQSDTRRGPEHPMLDHHVLDDAVGACRRGPGSTVSLAGTLALSSGTVTGTPIDLFRSVDGAADTSLGTVAAASDGVVRPAPRLTAGWRDTTYRAVYAGATDIAAASGWANTSVKQKQSSVTMAASDRA